jgi:hypothetical protein
VQVGRAGCGIPSTSTRATTRGPERRLGNESDRRAGWLRPGPRAVGLRQVDGIPHAPVVGEGRWLAVRQCLRRRGRMCSYEHRWSARRRSRTRATTPEMSRPRQLARPAPTSAAGQEGARGATSGAQTVGVRVSTGSIGQVAQVAGWVDQLDEITVSTVDATLRTNGSFPPPTVHILVEELDPPYVGYLTCRPFYI